MLGAGVTKDLGEPGGQQDGAARRGIAASCPAHRPALGFGQSLDTIATLSKQLAGLEDSCGHE